jgi:uncharacterized membrane protein HdeD (DUF308 family)
MKTSLTTVKQQGMRMVRHWYLPIIAGVLCIACGVFIFVYPLESYLLLAITLGVVILITSFVEIVMALSSRNWFLTRPWNIIGIIINILLGILLCSNPAINIILLPFLIGGWVFMRSLMLLSFSRDLSNAEIPIGNWLFALGLLLLILSVLIIVRPFAIGINMVIILSGVSFIIGGISLIVLSLNVRHLHSIVKKYLTPDTEEEEY